MALKRPDGTLRGYMKIGQDVTDRKRDEERQGVRLAELQHRVRNVLATVRSLVRRTVSGAVSLEEVATQLDGRIEALARTQALLTRAVGAGVDLDRLVHEELLAQAVDEDTVKVLGPPLQLAPKAAEVVGLAVHELATNAAKYGVFAHDGARLTITWTIDERDERRWLKFVWDVNGLQLDPSHPPRVGFGTELITRRVPYELNGRGKVELRPQGVRCEMNFPLVAGDSILDPTAPPGANCPPRCAATARPGNFCRLR